jgi:hypothetical protein
MVLLSDYRGGSAYGARHLIRSVSGLFLTSADPAGMMLGPLALPAIRLLFILTLTRWMSAGAASAPAARMRSDNTVLSTARAS